MGNAPRSNYIEQLPHDLLSISLMLPELTQLLIIQDKDQAIKRLQSDLKRLPIEEERARQKLLSDTQAVQVAKQKLQDNEVAMKNVQLLIATRRETINRLKVQQFETRKNDEYTALGNEVVRYSNEITGLEDQELELMEKAEELKSTVASAQQGLAASQKLVDAELAQLSERLTNVKTQLAELQTKRDGLASGVEEELLETYTRIWKHRGDAVVVALEGGVCRGCNMKVAPAVLLGAKNQKELTTCSNCGRLVYLE